MTASAAVMTEGASVMTEGSSVMTESRPLRLFSAFFPSGNCC